MKEKSETKATKPVVNTSILDAFELLRKPENTAKAIGGARIVSCFRVQEDQEKEHSSKYVLKRLIRSLGANVPDMRTGYFATLVTFLANQEHVTISELLTIVKKELHANGSIKSEIGDIALGKILVCGAIFRSGLMLRGTPEEQKEVLGMLISASTKKSYLSTSAYAILVDFVEKLSEEQFATIVWLNIKQELKKDIKEHSLDSLYFLLITSKKFPNEVKLRKLIGVPELLCEDTIHDICEKIMSGIDLSSVSHPVYSAIGKEIANSPHLLLFWQSGIDSQLTSHKRNRELVALNLLTTILNNMEVNHHLLPELITNNFFKLFMDWFKGLQTASKIRTKRDDEDDHKIVIKKEKELLNALSKAMKSDKVDGKVRVAMLRKLLFSPGEMTFTETTGTSVVKPIIADLDQSGVKKMIKSFKDILVNASKKLVKEGVERPWYNNERLKAAEYMSQLVNHESVKDDTEFRMSYMKILMCFSFFKIGGDENVSINAELAGSLKASFYRCFTSKFSTVDTLVDVLRSLCNFINEMLQNESLKKKLEKQFPQENLECWQALTDICKKIDSHGTKSKIDKVFLILLYQLGLFLFSEPTHVKMARGSIKELKSCYEHYKQGNSKKNKSLNGTDSSEEEPEWIEVLLEVLLSILSTDNSVLRSIVQCVFTLLSEYLTPTCIEQIISVLDPDSETNPLSHESESENESDNESENSDSNSDKADSDSEKESDDDTNDEGDADDDEDGDDLKTPDQLRLAVQKALGAAAPDSDVESIDADMIDEEEGKKLDEALAEAFKQFHQGKGKNSKKDRKDKKALADFRIRVLSLVDIYLEKDPSMDTCLTIMAPLLRCLEFCLLDNQFAELANRLRKTIRNLTKTKKFSSTEGITMEDLCEYLKAVVEKGSKSHFMYQALGDVITFFATFIIHCAQRIAPTKSKKNKTLLDIFTNYLQSFYKDRSCLLPSIFFHNILQTDWDDKYDLIAVIIDSVFNMEVRQYRRNEGLELLIGFYNSLKRIKPTSDLATAKILQIERKLEATLKSALTSSEFTAKNNFVVSLKKLLNVIKSYYDSCHKPSNLNIKELLEVVGSFKNLVKTEIVKKPMTNGETKHKKKKRKNKKQNGEQPMKKKRKPNSTIDADE